MKKKRIVVFVLFALSATILVVAATATTPSVVPEPHAQPLMPQSTAPSEQPQGEVPTKAAIVGSPQARPRPTGSAWAGPMSSMPADIRALLHMPDCERFRRGERTEIAGVEKYCAHVKP